MARAFYQKLSDRYRNFYYAELGRQRMKHLAAGADDATTTYALLDRVPPLDGNAKVEPAEPPRDELHVQKAELGNKEGRNPQRENEEPDSNRNRHTCPARTNNRLLSHVPFYGGAA